MSMLDENQRLNDSAYFYSFSIEEIKSMLEPSDAQKSAGFNNDISVFQAIIAELMTGDGSLKFEVIVKEMIEIKDENKDACSWFVKRFEFKIGECELKEEPRYKLIFHSENNLIKKVSFSKDFFSLFIKNKLTDNASYSKEELILEDNSKSGTVKNVNHAKVVLLVLIGAASFLGAGAVLGGLLVIPKIHFLILSLSATTAKISAASTCSALGGGSFWVAGKKNKDSREEEAKNDRISAP